MENHIGDGLGVTEWCLDCGGREDGHGLVGREPEFSRTCLDRDEDLVHIGMLIDLVASPGIVAVTTYAGYVTILQEGLVVIPVAATEEAGIIWY